MTWQGLCTWVDRLTAFDLLILLIGAWALLSIVEMIWLLLTREPGPMRECPGCGRMTDGWVCEDCEEGR